MTAFLSILDRSGAPVDPRRLARLAEPLAADGFEITTLCRGPVGIAVRYLAAESRPDAHRRYGPHVDPETGTMVAIAGRVAAARGTDGIETPGLADAAGDDDLPFLAGLCGPFALIAAHPERGWLRIARDHLGAQKVFHVLDRSFLIAASEPAPILRHEAVSDDLDEGSAARFLGFRFGWTGRSFFRAVRELPPAHRLHVSATEVRIDRYWRLSTETSRRHRPDDEVSADFRRLLRRSIARDAADLPPERIALSLSGGLDSTAIAALAPPGVRAVSWRFDEPELGDERAGIEAVSESLGLPVRWIRGDDLYPLAGGLDAFAERFVHPGSPYVNAFAPLKERLYRTARDEGCERVLVGDGGDALYAAREHWLRDALRSDGGLASLISALARTAARAARPGPAGRFARLSLARLLGLPRGTRTRLGLRASPWLTPEGRALLPRPEPWPLSPADARRSDRERYQLVAGPKHSELESEERLHFAHYGVERGNPYWSWPLLEWTLGLPADRLHRDGRDKVLIREALRGRLPERVLASRRVGTLEELFLRGIERHHDEIRETVFRRPRSDWRRYVRPEWVEAYLPGPGTAARSIAFGHTILWRVICYELWQRRLLEPGRGE